MNAQTTHDGIDLNETQWLEVVKESTYGENTFYYLTGQGNAKDVRDVARFKEDGTELNNELAHKVVEEFNGETMSRSEIVSVEVVKEDSVPEEIRN